MSSLFSIVSCISCVAVGPSRPSPGGFCWYLRLHIPTQTTSRHSAVSAEDSPTRKRWPSCRARAAKLSLRLLEGSHMTPHAVSQSAQHAAQHHRLFDNLPKQNKLVHANISSFTLIVVMLLYCELSIFLQKDM